MATHTNEDSVFESFIIPCNVSFVDNQRDIIRSVILKNALLNLNNGNNKWHICATLIYNYYRWFNKYKTIFVSTTQSELSNICKIINRHFNIPPNDILTVKNDKDLNTDGHKIKYCSVLLMTADAFKMLLTGKLIPMEDTRFIIFDSVDHAGKRAVYKMANNFLNEYRSNLRLMALVSLPKCPIRRLQDIIGTFRLSCYASDFVEVDEAENVVVSNGELISSLQDQIDQIYCRFGRKLKEASRLHANLASLTVSEIKKIKETFSREKQSEFSAERKKEILQNFDACIVLLTAMRTLKILGIYSADYYLFVDAVTGVPENLLNDPQFQCLRNTFRQILDNDKQKIVSHPKLEMLKLKVEEHAKSQRAERKEVSVVIFCEDTIQMTDVCNTIRSIGDVDTYAVIMKNDRVFNQFVQKSYNILITTSIEKKKLKLLKIGLAIFIGINALQRFTKTNDNFPLKKYVTIMNEEEFEQFEKLYKKELFNTSKDGQIELDKFCQQFVSESPKLLPPGNSFPTEQIVDVSPQKAKPELQNKRKSVFPDEMDGKGKKNLATWLLQSDNDGKVENNGEEEGVVNSYNSDVADRVFQTQLRKAPPAEREDIIIKRKLSDLSKRLTDNSVKDDDVLIDLFVQNNIEITSKKKENDDAKVIADNNATEDFSSKLVYVQTAKFDRDYADNNDDNNLYLFKKKSSDDTGINKEVAFAQLFSPSTIAELASSSSSIDRKEPSSPPCILQNVSNVDLFESIDLELLDAALDVALADIMETTIGEIKCDQVEQQSEPSKSGNERENTFKLDSDDDPILPNKRNCQNILHSGFNDDSNTTDDNSNSITLKQAMPDDDDEEEEESIIKFQSTIRCHRALTTASLAKSKKSETKIPNKKKLRKEWVATFFDEEAEEDSDELKSDDDDDDDDLPLDTSEYDASFIDNDEQTDRSDIEAVYLQSIRSPKSRPVKKTDKNVGPFVGYYVQDESYEMDSFCVPDSDSN